MYGPAEAARNEVALLEPQRSLQNVGAKKKDDEDDRGHTPGGEQFQAFGADGFTFLDFLDIINPLQHIPIVGTAYREMTGDEIDPASRVIGGTLFGGPIGTVAALVNVSVEQSTGKDMGEHVLAFFDGEDGAPADGTAPMLANAPDGQLASTAGIGENIEVLDWARREAAFMGHPDTEAALNPASVGQASVEQAMTNPAAAGVSDATAHALRVTQRSGDVAGNIEVLDWARKEVAATRAAVAKAQSAHKEEKGEINRTQESTVQTAENRTTQTLARHDQQTGATAPSGGWFSETMVSALASYEQSAQLGKVEDSRQGLKAANLSN